MMKKLKLIFILLFIVVFVLIGKHSIDREKESYIKGTASMALEAFIELEENFSEQAYNDATAKFYTTYVALCYYGGDRVRYSAQMNELYGHLIMREPLGEEEYALIHTILHQIEVDYSANTLLEQLLLNLLNQIECS